MPARLPVLIVLSRSSISAPKMMEPSTARLATAPRVPSYYFATNDSDVLLFTEIDDYDPDGQGSRVHLTNQIYERILDWYRWNEEKVPMNLHGIAGAWIVGKSLSTYLRGFDGHEILQRLAALRHDESMDKVEREERAQLKRLYEKYGAP